MDNALPSAIITDANRAKRARRRRTILFAGKKVIDTVSSAIYGCRMGPLDRTRPSGRVAVYRNPPACALFRGLTTSVVLSPFFRLLNFQPLLIKMLGLPNSMLQCFSS